MLVVPILTEHDDHYTEYLTMNTTIIDRLNATINDRVEANLAQIRGMEAAIADAIAEAELIATRRIEAAAESLNATLETQLAELDFRLAVVATNAFAAACDRIAATLDPTQQDTPEPTATPEPTIIPCPIPTYEEILAEQNEAEQEADDTCTDCGRPDVYCACGDQSDENAYIEPTATVAAHAVECEQPAHIDEDEDGTEDDVDHDDDSAIMETAGDQDGLDATTEDPDGLHERRGQGRGTRYTPVDFPLYGSTYYRKMDGRWQPVAYIGVTN